MSEEDSRTLFIGNIANDVTEDILYELFLQGGPIDHVKIPFDKNTNTAKNFGFVCYKDECSVPYAYYLFNGTPLCGKNIKVQTRRNTQAIPPMDSVGTHSLDPEFGKQNNSYNQTNTPSLMDGQSILGNYPGQANSLMPLIPIVPPLNSASYMNYNNGFQGYASNVPPSIDTNSINSFKNSHDNYAPYNNYRNNSYGHQSNHYNGSSRNNGYGNQGNQYYGYQTNQDNYSSRHHHSNQNSYRHGHSSHQDGHSSRRYDSNNRSRDRDSSRSNNDRYSQSRGYNENNRRY